MSLDKIHILALNYDLLLQYPIHRLQGNEKILTKLSLDKNAALIADETLTNEAFDIIEALFQAYKETGNTDYDEKDLAAKDHRLKRLIPLLLYRYRLVSEIDAKSAEDTVVPHTDSNAMVTEHNKEIMQVLPFNFRPYNTGLLYNNWPIGRSKEVIVTTESAEAEKVNDSKYIVTHDENVYYIAEPLDKIDWLNAKRSTTDVPFNAEKFYHYVDAYFKKYAPLARIIRKARFRSTFPETFAFRTFLFQTKFAGDNSTTIASDWDSIWQNSFDSLRYDLVTDEKKRWNLLANFLVIIQPTTVSKFAVPLKCFNDMLHFATRSWTNYQINLLERLLRATPYENGFMREIADRKNRLLSFIFDGFASECNSTAIAAATLLFFAALRSQFDPILCPKKETKQNPLNTMFRVVVSTEQSINTPAATHSVALSVNQLWKLSEKLLLFLRNQTNMTFDSADFVSNFVLHVLTTENNLQNAKDAILEESVSNTLEQFIPKKQLKNEF